MEKVPLGYSNSPGGILNAYRDGDISFDKAKEELKTLINKGPKGKLFTVLVSPKYHYLLVNHTTGGLQSSSKLHLLVGKLYRQLLSESKQTEGGEIGIRS